MPEQTDDEVFRRVVQTLPGGVDPWSMIRANSQVETVSEARRIFLSLPETEQQSVRRHLVRQQDPCGR